MYKFDFKTKGLIDFPNLYTLQLSTKEGKMNVISEYIALHYDSSLELMKGSSRKLIHFWPRAVAMYVIRNINGYDISLKTIGRYFGGRDHSSVINAIESVEDMMDTNKDFKHKVELLISKLK